MSDKSITLNLNLGERFVLLGILLNQGGDHKHMAKVAAAKEAIRADKMQKNPTTELLYETDYDFDPCEFDGEIFVWFAALALEYDRYSGQFAEWVTTVILKVKEAQQSLPAVTE